MEQEAGPGSVAVWSDYWLPTSETFIANQIQAMQRWPVVRIGLRRLESGLPVEPDLAPFDQSLPSKLAWRLAGARAHLPAYLDLLRERQVVLLHAHFGPGAINVLPIARRSGLPLVVTFHGYDATQLPQQPGRRGAAYRRRLSEVFRRADRLIAVSDHIRTRLLELGAPESKTVVRYLGAAAVTAPGDSSSTLPAPPREGLVFVGRLIEKKGVADLLRAVAGLPAPLHRTPVAILGAGVLLPELRALAESLGVNATFHGRVTPEEVSAALTSAAVFCGPSRTARDGDTEGLPISLIEAAHHGATLVATRHAGIPEFARHGHEALLVEEGDVPALSAALTRVLTDPDLARRLADRARTRARAGFDVRSCTAALETLYDEVWRGRTGGPGPHTAA